jgi:hypothetical protein
VVAGKKENKWIPRKKTPCCEMKNQKWKATSVLDGQPNDF